MKFIIIEQRTLGDGENFWEHAKYRLKIGEQIAGTGLSALETLEMIEGAMRQASYSQRAK